MMHSVSRLRSTESFLLGIMQVEFDNFALNLPVNLAVGRQYRQVIAKRWIRNLLYINMLCDFPCCVDVAHRLQLLNRENYT